MLFEQHLVLQKLKVVRGSVDSFCFMRHAFVFFVCRSSYLLVIPRMLPWLVFGNVCNNILVFDELELSTWSNDWMNK